MTLVQEVREAAVDVLRDDSWPLNPVSGLHERATLFGGQRTNLCLQSEALGTSPWSALQGVAVTLDAIAAPEENSPSTADLLEDGSANYERVRQVFTVADDSLTHAVSGWVKDFSGDLPCLQAEFTGGTQLNYMLTLDPVTGDVAWAANGDAGLLALAKKYVNGWWRVKMAVANNGTGNTTLNVYCVPALATSLGGNSVGSATGGAYFWGIQVEKADFPSSYIPTTTAAASREADGSFTIPLTPADPTNGATVYARLIDKGTFSHNFSGPHILRYGGDTNRYRLYRASSQGVRWQREFVSGFASTRSTLPAYGTELEFLAHLNTDGTLRLQYFEDRTLITDNSGDPGTDPVEWGANAGIEIPGPDPAFMALFNVEDAEGIKTIEQMRTQAGVS